MAKYIYQHENWTNFIWDEDKIRDLFGKLQSSKWAKICKCSQDTATRDIKDLIEKGILKQEEGGGRNTNYELTEIQNKISGIVYE